MAKKIFPAYLIIKKTAFVFTKQVIVDIFVNKEGKEVKVKRDIRDKIYRQLEIGGFMS